MFVYLIRNSSNGKMYVGKTVSPDLGAYLKHQFHCANSGITGKPHLYAAIRKHGESSFSIAPILRADTDKELCDWEKHFIALLFTRDARIGYNITEGGIGKQVGSKHSEETKAKMSASQIGKVIPQEQRDQIRETVIKLWESEEYRANHKAAMAKVFADPEYQAKTKAANAAKRGIKLGPHPPRTPETRQKLSEIAKARWSVPGVREKLSADQKAGWARKHAEAMA